MSWFDNQYGLFRRDGNWVTKCCLNGKTREIVLGNNKKISRERAQYMHRKIVATLINPNKKVDQKNEHSKHKDE